MTKIMQNLQNFTQLLSQQILALPVPNLEDAQASEGNIIMDFPGYPGIELSLLLNEHSTPTGLSLAILLTKEDTEEETAFLEELYNGYLTIAKLLQDYLETIFSETTNSDACSFSIIWDTHHASMPGTEGLWELNINITDYLS